MKTDPLIIGYYVVLDPGYLDEMEISYEQLVNGTCSLRTTSGKKYNIKIKWVDYDNDTGFSEFRFEEPMLQSEFDDLCDLPYHPILYVKPKPNNNEKEE